MKKITRILKSIILINTCLLISETLSFAQLKPVFNVIINGGIYDLEFSPDGLYVAVGGMMPVNLIKLTTQEVIQIDQIGEHGLGYIQDLKFSQDGSKLVAARADRRLLSYFDVTDKKLIRDYQVEDIPPFKDIFPAGGSISPDQSMVVLGLESDLYFWSTSDGNLLDKIEINASDIYNINSNISRIDFLNENQIYVRTNAAEAVLVDIGSITIEKKTAGYLVDNNYVLAQSNDTTNSKNYQLNNILTNAFVKEYIIPGDNVMDIILNDANLVITKQNLEFELKKLTADNNPQTLTKFALELDPEYARSKFSPDGKMVAIYAGDTMSFYDISDLTSSIHKFSELSN